MAEKQEKPVHQQIQITPSLAPHLKQLSKMVTCMPGGIAEDLQFICPITLKKKKERRKNGREEQREEEKQGGEGSGGEGRVLFPIV